MSLRRYISGFQPGDQGPRGVLNSTGGIEVTLNDLKQAKTKNKSGYFFIMSIDIF